MADRVPDQLPINESNAKFAFPGFWRRLLINGLFWGLLFGYLFLFLPQWFPIYAKLEEKEALPSLTRSLWIFVRFVEAFFYLPVVIGATLFVALDQYFAKKTRNGCWHSGLFLCWTFTIRCICLILLVLAIRGTFLPKFRYPSMQVAAAPLLFDGLRVKVRMRGIHAPS